MYVHQNLGSMYICGDVNSKCGDMADFIEGVNDIIHTHSGVKSSKTYTLNMDIMFKMPTLMGGRIVNNHTLIVGVYTYHNI